MRVALLTGATGKLGPAVARALAGDGWSLVLHHRASHGRAEALAAELGAEVEAADLGDPQVARALAARVLARRGRVDALIHAAGGFAEEPLLASRPESWRAEHAVHVEAFHALAVALAPAMRARGDGRLVGFGLAGMDRWPSYRRVTGHAASKASLLVVVRALAAELAGDGVTANLIAPGRAPAPHHVAELVRFLCSPAAAGINGALVPVDAP